MPSKAIDRRMNSGWNRAKKTLRPRAPSAAPTPQGKQHASVARAAITAATGVNVETARSAFVNGPPAFAPRGLTVRPRNVEAHPAAFRRQGRCGMRSLFRFVARECSRYPFHSPGRLAIQESHVRLPPDGP